MTKEEARGLLKERGLRVTGPRVTVLRLLAEADRPLSHTEVVQRMGDEDCDPATIYRNLVKLREVGLAPVVSRAEGIDRYALATSKGDDHHHPHFVCDDCGRVACLPDTVALSMPTDDPWALSVSQAVVQLRGECPDCRKEHAK